VTDEPKCRHTQWRSYTFHRGLPNLTFFEKINGKLLYLSLWPQSFYAQDPGDPVVWLRPWFLEMTNFTLIDESSNQSPWITFDHQTVNKWRCDIPCLLNYGFVCTIILANGLYDILQYDSRTKTRTTDVITSPPFSGHQIGRTGGPDLRFPDHFTKNKKLLDFREINLQSGFLSQGILRKRRLTFSGINM